MAHSQPRGPEELPLPTQTPKPSEPPKLPEIPITLVLAQEKLEWDEKFQNQRANMRLQLISALQVKRKSTVLAYFSESTLDYEDADLINDLLSNLGHIKKLDLFLQSPGGIIDAAYKIVCLCREYCDSFGVLVPYRAKSAATLIALGADEILMGPSSEIGPIDPMIEVKNPERGSTWIPAQSIRDTLKLFDTEVGQDPNRSLLFMPVMSKIDPWILGAYERALKSSQQYAEALLSKYMLKTDSASAKKVAEDLATGYYSHGYAIDRRIAKEQLKLNVVFADAEKELWDYMWRLYKLYEALLKEKLGIQAIFETSKVRLEKSGERR